MSSGGDSVPAICVTTDDEEQSLKRTIKFQCGLLRETETFVNEDVDILCLETLLEYVCDMLNYKVNSATIQKYRIYLDVAMCTVCVGSL